MGGRCVPGTGVGTTVHAWGVGSVYDGDVKTVFHRNVQDPSFPFLSFHPPPFHSACVCLPSRFHIPGTYHHNVMLYIIHGSNALLGVDHNLGHGELVARDMGVACGDITLSHTPALATAEHVESK